MVRVGYNKFHAKKVVVDGITFASKREANRYTELRLLERAKEISNLQMQVPYELVPKCGKNRPVKYYADFVYKDKDGNTIVEDTKGKRLPEYIIKKKLMKYVYNIDIKEI